MFRLADEYGRVLVANAYADWRMRDVNQYQADLYGLGIELVHVLGQRRGAVIKNAADVKMAVDAVSLMSTLPHIDVYVIVSGDRDFIHSAEGTAAPRQDGDRRIAGQVREHRLLVTVRPLPALRSAHLDGRAGKGRVLRKSAPGSPRSSGRTRTG